MGWWNSTAPKTCWGTASNTQDNASIPVAGDAVIFDGVGFGASNCTIPGGYNPSFGTIVCTGYSHTIMVSGNTITVDGNTLTFSSGMSFFGSPATWRLTSTSGTVALTTNGEDLGNLTVAVTGTCQLQDNISLYDSLVVESGTFDTNNKTISAVDFNSSGTTTRTLSLGSSVISLSGYIASGDYNVWDCSTVTNLTVTAGTSTIYFTKSGTDTGNRYFQGGGKTYYNLKLASSNVVTRIYGSNTFNNINQEIASTTTPSIKIEAGKTQTITSLTMTGYSSSKRITLGSVTAATHTISCATGTITADHIDISYSTASGGATFNARPDGIDSGNNTGWSFPAISSYSGAVTIGVTPGSSYADFATHSYSGSIPLAIVPSSASHKNTEWIGSIGIGITPSHTRVRDINRTGNLGVTFVPSSVKAVTLNRSGNLSVSFSVTSLVQKVNSTYHGYTWHLTQSFGVTSTVVIRKRLRVVDPVVTGGCPQCGCLIYNR
ncbi:hypothetical protein CCP3SC15_150017 [Gammaproteobacteria bacterium]